MVSVWGGIALMLATKHFSTFTRKGVAAGYKVFSIKVTSDFS